MASIPVLAVHSHSKGEAMPSPSYVDARVLAASTAETVTIPTGTGSKAARYVQFKATGNFYFNGYAAAAVPAADVTDGSASMLNPDLLYIGDVGADFSIIAPTADTIVTMAFFE